jgi:hypothetical protein
MPEGIRKVKEQEVRWRKAEGTGGVNIEIGKF